MDSEHVLVNVFGLHGAPKRCTVDAFGSPGPQSAVLSTLLCLPGPFRLLAPDPDTAIRNDKWGGCGSVGERGRGIVCVCEWGT